MQIGFAVPNGPATAGPDDLRRLVVAGEALGFDYATFSDHVVIPNVIEARYPYSSTGAFPARARSGHHEQLIAMSHASGATSTLRLVTSVLVVPYRPVLLTAKMLATLDVLSNGRLTVGVGSGWMKDEFDALGVEFVRRGRLTDEYLAAFVELWTQPCPAYEGEFVAFREISLEPKPRQLPHPPIWIGGMGPAAMRRAAAFGDAWYPVIDDPSRPLNSLALCSAAIDELRNRCEANGRSADSVNLALRVAEFGNAVPLVAQDGTRRLFSGTPADIAEDLEALAELGVRGVDFRFDSETALAGPSTVTERMSCFSETVLSRVLRPLPR